MTVDGIDIKIEKKNIKNMYLKIKRDGTVTVSVPLRFSDDTVNKFISEKLTWIKKKLARISAANLAADAAVAFVFGEKYPLRFADSQKAKAVFDGETVTVYAAKTELETALSVMYSELLLQKLALIAEEAERLAGKRASRWRIRSMKTRWGSCNVKTASVTLSSNLARYPEKCILSVAVHELCHLYEPSHNKRFHALCREFFPEYGECEKLLNEHACGV